MEIHPLASILPKDPKEPYVEFLRNRNLSAGIYALPIGATDKQSPHTEDEIYYVISGAAHFTNGQRDEPVKSGDVLFVAAHEPHRFHSITEPLQLLVFFAPPEGSTKAT